MFIIRVLKLLFMHGKYILPAFVLILLVCSPVAASTSKIAVGAPVFIGETNLDITSAIGDCHVIAWWPDAGNTSAPPVINLTVKNLNEANGLSGHFNVSPRVFLGHTGNWYCQDMNIPRPILYVVDPQFTIRVWDTDNDKDISGQTVPVTTNVTYRIDTNLYQYAGYYNRTNLNPSDTIFTIKMTDPLGRNVPNIYTGNAGAASTEITSFDSSPFITTPVYFGKNMNGWYRLSRDARGDLIYPPGTYIITASQNLGNMKQAYSDAGITSQDGITTGTTSVTFSPPPTLAPVVTTQPVAANITGTAQPQETQTIAAVPTSQPVARKTPYQPLPWWVAVMATGTAGLLFALKRAP
jgi:Domain of unknown function (DUF3821)